MATLKSLNIDGDLILDKTNATHPNGTTVAVDLATGNYFEADLQNVSGDITTFTITEALSGEQVQTFVLKVTQGSTPRDFAWNSLSAIKWSGSDFPSGNFTASDSGMDMLLTNAWPYGDHGLSLGDTFRVSTTGTFPAGDSGGGSNIVLAVDTDFYVYGTESGVSYCGQGTGFTTTTWKPTKTQDAGNVSDCPLYFENAGSGTHSWYTQPNLTTTSNAVDIFQFTTYDAGTTWHGKVVGQNFT